MSTLLAGREEVQQVVTKEAASDFREATLTDLKIRNEEEQDKARELIGRIASWLLEKTKTGTIPRTVTKAIKAYIAEIDRVLSEQLSEILHHPEFQALEGTWRGLHYLVNNSELSANRLEIQVLNITKSEVTQITQDYSGTSWDDSPLFDKIYTREYGVLGGRPFGCLVGDYYFDNSLDDVDTLEGMSKVAAAAHVPFISSVNPGLMEMENWQELNGKRELAKIFTGKKYLRWNKMREGLDMRYIALTMPKVLAREPFGAKTRRIDDFAFEENMAVDPEKVREMNAEDLARAMHANYCWTNAAYALARNIGQAFNENGWCVRIRGVEGGGLVEKLPQHCFETSDGTTDVKIPSEVLIPDRREKELSDLGFIPICYIKNSPDAVFLGGQSLHKPSRYGSKKGKVASANHALSARIPYTFAVCRFTHFIKAMVRDKIGSDMGAKDIQDWLQEWIDDYVLPNPDGKGATLRAEKPLQAAKIEVKGIEEDPGYYNATVSLLPHYQLEGMTTEIGFDVELKQVKP